MIFRRSEGVAQLFAAQSQEFARGGRTADGAPAAGRVVGSRSCVPDQAGPDGDFIPDDESR